MTRLPISISMISGAEAHRIERSLESIADWTSEIIVVLNQEVQDGTEEKALEFGAKVFREPWKGYLAQKNSAAEKSTQPWVFNLDADEVVSPELRAELAALFADASRLHSFAALSFPRLSWFCGRWIRHGEWYPDRQTRIWRRGHARWGGVDPHAKLLVAGETFRMKGNLLHFSTDSINLRLGKIIPYSDDFVAQRRPSGRLPGMFSLAARPMWRFFRGYFIKLGLLDGWQGFYLAGHTAFTALVRYAKVREQAKRGHGADGAPRTP